MLNKTNRLRGRNKFRKVFKYGKKLRADTITVYALSGSEFRVAFVIPKIVGNAVVRNRFRRVLSEAVRLNKDLFSNKYLIFRVEKNLPDDFNKLCDLIRNVAGRLNGKNPDTNN